MAAAAFWIWKRSIIYLFKFYLHQIATNLVCGCTTVTRRWHMTTSWNRKLFHVASSNGCWED